MSITEQIKASWAEMRGEYPIASLLLALSVAFPLLSMLLPPLWPFIPAALVAAGYASAAAMFIVLIKPFINAIKDSL